MAFFLSEINKLKKGEIANISISQLVNHYINLSEARFHLSDEYYNYVFELFSCLKLCKTKIPMNQQLFLNITLELIHYFNEFAPYEYYSGRAKEEALDLVDGYDSVIEDVTYNIEAKKYAYYIKDAGEFKLDFDDAMAFSNILTIYMLEGKDICLRLFDIFARKLIRDKGYASLDGFYVGLLVGNKVISEEESKKLNEMYVEYQIHYCQSHRKKFSNTKQDDINIEEPKEKKCHFKCSECGALVEEDAEFCPNCGEEFDEEDDCNEAYDTNIEVINDDIKEEEVEEDVEEDDDDEVSTSFDEKYNKLIKLKNLLDDGILTKEEFDAEKKKILNG